MINEYGEHISYLATIRRRRGKPVSGCAIDMYANERPKYMQEFGTGTNHEIIGEYETGEEAEAAVLSCFERRHYHTSCLPQ